VIAPLLAAAAAAAGAAWGASNAELACYAEGRREKAPFEGLALDSLFDVGAARLVSCWAGFLGV
jgi:hypothetical protein